MLKKDAEDRIFVIFCKKKFFYSKKTLNLSNANDFANRAFSVHKIDERVEAVHFTRDSLVVDLMDGRSISVPLDWYPRLLKATPKERASWEICGGGYGIHWPDVDEDLNTEGLLRGARAPLGKMKPTKRALKSKRRSKTKMRS